MNDDTYEQVTTSDEQWQSRVPTVNLSARRVQTDLDTQLERLSVSLSESLVKLLREDRYERVVKIVESDRSLPLSLPERQRIIQQIEDRRAQVFAELKEYCRAWIEVGNLDRAREVVQRARRVDAHEVAALEVSLRRAELDAEALARRAERLEHARRLVTEGSLERMRDARAVYRELLDGADPESDEVRHVRAEYKQLEMRLDFEMADQAAIHTHMLLEDLKPRLDALDKLYALRQRGDEYFYPLGDQAEPLPAVIDRYECELRAMLSQQVLEDVAGAHRLVADGEVRAALRRLQRYERYWHLIGGDLHAEAEDKRRRLEAVVRSSQEVRDARDRAYALLDAGDTPRAIELIELARDRIEGDVSELDELLETVRRHRLLPISNQLDDLTHQATRLSGLWARQLDGLLQSAEELSGALAAVVHQGAEVQALRARHQELLTLLNGLVDAREQHDAGRFEQSRAVLERLTRTLPTHRETLELHLAGALADREVEELLDRIRRLSSDDPEEALALARQNAPRDIRFREFADHALVERALHRAEAFERRGEYRRAIEELQTTTSQLSSRRNERLDQEIKRVASVLRDASAVGELLDESAHADSDDEREGIAARMSDLEVGIDRVDVVNMMLAAQIPRRLHSLRSAMTAWRRTGAVSLDRVEADARFLRRRVQPPGPELTHLLGWYDFAVVLLEAQQTLHAGAFDEAQRIVEPFLPGPFGARAQTFIMRCRARSALATAHAEIAELQIDAARRTLQSAPATDLEVQAAKLFVERFEVAIRPLLKPTAAPERHALDSPSSLAPIEAFRAARALIDEQPDSPTFQQALVRLARARVLHTRARLEDERRDVPGHVLAQMAWLTHDVEAAGRIEPEFERLVTRVHAQAEDDLRAVFEWVDRVESVAAPRLADLYLVRARLTALKALRLDDGVFAAVASVDAYLDRCDQLVHRLEVRDRDRATVERLLTDATGEGGRRALEQAVEIERTYPDRPFGAEERAEAWDEADRLVAEIERLVMIDQLADALRALELLVQRCEAHPLPHASRIKTTRADGQSYGPGAPSMIATLSREVEERRRLRSTFDVHLDGLERRLDELEQQRRELMLEAINERAPRSVVAMATRRLGHTADEHLEDLRQRAVETRRLGVEERTERVIARFVTLTTASLRADIERRRCEVDEAVRRLDQFRREGPRGIERRGEQIERYGEDFAASVRVQRYVGHFRLRIRSDHRL